MMECIAVAWYPEHCDESRWEQDIQQMTRAGINAVRVLEFAWSRMERGDAQWDFAWVHRFMERLVKAGIGVVPCTPSASPPRWLTQAHPECLQVTAKGDAMSPGARRHYCPTSKVYRQYTNRLARRMQEELADYPNILAWQIDNELGFNRCFCPECELAFRQGMRRKYGTLEKLNEALGGAFWSTDCWQWDELTLPRQSPSPEMRLAYDQFYSDSIIEFMAEQVRALKAGGCRAPISTNMMADFQQIDYWKAAEYLDVIGWDNYFDQFTLAGDSLAHNLMRSLKQGKGYWTFENGVNSVSPWLQSAPGFMTTHALSGMAHGEIGHTIFRWDSCPFGHEQDLQGLVDWSGRPRAKLEEIRKLIQTLGAMEEMPPLAPRVALIYSWQNYWGTGPYYGAHCHGDTYASYWPEVERYYQALFDLGVACDCVSPDGDFSGYDLVIAPGLALVTDEQIGRLRAYVQAGGVLFAGRKTFCKQMTGSYRRAQHPDGLGDVFGMRVAESQSNEDGNDLTVRSAAERRPFRQWHLSPAEGFHLPPTATHGWFEVLEPAGASVIYEYRDGYFPGRPAATQHAFGAGHAFYLGAAVDRPAMREVMREVLTVAGITRLIEVPDGAQVVQRGQSILATNHTAAPLTLRLPAPVAATHWGPETLGSEVTLPPFGFLWLELQWPVSSESPELVQA